MAVTIRATRRINLVRADRILAGVCRDCGKGSVDGNKVVCYWCHIKRSQTGKLIRTRRIAENICVQCNKSHTKAATICQTCTDRSIQQYRIRRRDNRLLVVKYFGNKCSCGEDNICTLSLHHVDGDGQSDRKSKKAKRANSPTWYARLAKQIKNNEPFNTRLELLCFNCHAKKDLVPWWLKE